MNFKDLKESILGNLRKGAASEQQEQPDMESNMSNGGFSGYRPNQTRRNNFGTQSMKAVDTQQPNGNARGGLRSMTGIFARVNDNPYAAPPMMPYPAQQQGFQQDPAGAYTASFGGFQGGYGNQQPPMGTAQQPPVQPNSWQQPPMNTMQQPPVQSNPWPQQPMNTAQQPTAQQWQQPVNNAPQQSNPWPQQPQSEPQQRKNFTNRIFPRKEQTQQPQQESNISYINNVFVGNDGKAYRHVERVAQLVSVSACFRIIEFMRNGESVVVNTESIANEADVQRCLDMLAGAAFTLGCSLTKITQVKRAYLIAPATVLVMQDTAVSRWNDHDQMPQNEPAGDQYQNRFRPDRSVYAPDRQWEPEQAMTYPQTAPAYSEPAPSPYQQTSRQQAARTQPREAYNSDTRRGFYGTAAGQNFGSFGQ